VRWDFVRRILKVASGGKEKILFFSDFMIVLFLFHTHHSRIQTCECLAGDA
jgi:hypothetical protein